MRAKRTGLWLGIPYDLRRPTWRRLRERWWNPNDVRLFTPKLYGWGYDMNAYWLVHPVAWVRRRRAAR